MEFNAGPQGNEGVVKEAEGGTISCAGARFAGDSSEDERRGLMCRSGSVRTNCRREGARGCWKDRGSRSGSCDVK